jgi:hypothetical protein
MEETHKRFKHQDILLGTKKRVSSAKSANRHAKDEKKFLK